MIGARVVIGRRAPGSSVWPTSARRVDDHELVALDQPERTPARADRGRHALDEDAGDVLGRERGRESRGQVLEALHAAARVLGLDDGVDRAVLAAAEGKADQRDEDADGERGQIAHELVTVRKAELATRLREDDVGEAPADEDAERAAESARQPDGDRDGADERRVRRLVAEEQQRGRGGKPDEPAAAPIAAAPRTDERAGGLRRLTSGARCSGSLQLTPIASLQRARRQQRIARGRGRPAPRPSYVPQPQRLGRSCRSARLVVLPLERILDPVGGVASPSP